MSINDRKLKEFATPQEEKLSLELLREACGGDSGTLEFALEWSRLRAAKLGVPIEQVYREAALAIGIEIAICEATRTPLRSLYRNGNDAAVEFNYDFLADAASQREATWRDSVEIH
jgi:hypothetical protein